MSESNNWLKVLVKPTSNLTESIKVLHDGGIRIALVVDDKNKLLGTLTDGDFRLALLNNVEMSSSVKDVMNTNPIVASNKDSREFILSLMNKTSTLHIPIINDLTGEICGLETIQNLAEKPSYDNPVFILAGGFGKRLYPLTENTPKPLLKVGNKPILERIIGQFIENGFHNFYISTYFKSELIKDYFKDGSILGINICYLEEDIPLGTAGSLGLLPDNIPNLPIIVINGDILTNIDFNVLLDFHNDHNTDVTMCVREYDFQVPYGVVNIDNYNVTEINEKPVHKFFVNAGIYVLNNNFVKNLDGKSYLDMPDLLKKKLNNGGVSAFPIHEYWLDIGQKEEYVKANNDVKSFNEL